MPRIEFDPRYVEIAYEFWGFGEFLKHLEPELAHLRAKDEAEMRERLKLQGYDFYDEEVQLAFQELNERTERVFPRLLRGPFLMALWGAYQASVEEVAEGLRRERKIAIGLKDLNGGFFQQADKYFSRVLQLSLDTSPERQLRIRDFYELRNWLAHANGRVYPLSNKKATSLPALAKTYGNEVDGGYFVPSADYLQSCYKDITGSTSGLVARARGNRSQMHR